MGDCARLKIALILRSGKETERLNKIDEPLKQSFLYLNTPENGTATVPITDFITKVKALNVDAFNAEFKDADNKNKRLNEVNETEIQRLKKELAILQQQKETEMNNKIKIHEDEKQQAIAYNVQAKINEINAAHIPPIGMKPFNSYIGGIKKRNITKKSMSIKCGKKKIKTHKSPKQKNNKKPPSKLTRNKNKTSGGNNKTKRRNR